MLGHLYIHELKIVIEDGVILDYRPYDAPFNKVGSVIYEAIDLFNEYDIEYNYTPGSDGNFRYSVNNNGVSLYTNEIIRGNIEQTIIDFLSECHSV